MAKKEEERQIVRCDVDKNMKTGDTTSDTHSLACDMAMFNHKIK